MGRPPVFPCYDCLLFDAKLAPEVNNVDSPPHLVVVRIDLFANQPLGINALKAYRDEASVFKNVPIIALNGLSGDEGVAICKQLNIPLFRLPFNPSEFEKLVNELGFTNNNV